MKVLQSAPVECIEDVSARSRPLEPRIHLVTVLQLKQEVWRRRRNTSVFHQVTKFGILVEIREAQCEQSKKVATDAEVYMFSLVVTYLIFL